MSEGNQESGNQVIRNQVKKLFSLIDLNDVMAVAGLGLVGYGLSLVSTPLALVVVGVLLLVYGIVGAAVKGRSR
jgi:hypothetical protein